MLTRNKPMSRGRRPDRQARPDRSDEFASHRMPAVHAVMATPASFDVAVAKPPLAAKLSRQARTDNAIRASANGEECHVRLLGICNGRTDTTVWSHWPGLDADRGMGLKSVDVAGAYACAACHDAVDGRTRTSAEHDRSAIVFGWMLGHLRSLVTLARKGLV